jgi:hypothetical protein
MEERELHAGAYLWRSALGYADPLMAPGAFRGMVDERIGCL